MSKRGERVSTRDERSKEDNGVFKELSFWLEHESVRDVINAKLYYWQDNTENKGKENEKNDTQDKCSV